jgi:hypothetical protein
MEKSENKVFTFTLRRRWPTRQREIIECAKCAQKEAEATRIKNSCATMVLTAGDTTSALLLSNLRILNIVSPGILTLTLQIVSSEATLYSLFQALSPEETAKVKLSP